MGQVWFCEKKISQFFSKNQIHHLPCSAHKRTAWFINICPRKGVYPMSHNSWYTLYDHVLLPLPCIHTLYMPPYQVVHWFSPFDIHMRVFEFGMVYIYVNVQTTSSRGKCSFRFQCNLYHTSFHSSENDESSTCNKLSRPIVKVTTLSHTHRRRMALLNQMWRRAGAIHCTYFVNHYYLLFLHFWV